jgi:hypothetical protein
MNNNDEIKNELAWYNGIMAEESRKVMHHLFEGKEGKI